MKIGQKRRVGYLHFPVCPYSGMAGRRLEVEEEATNKTICGNGVSAECPRMQHYRGVGAYDGEGIHILLHGSQPPTLPGEISFELASLSKI